MFGAVESGPSSYQAENRGPTIIAVIASTTAVAVLFIAARMYSRHLAARRFWIDDYLIVLSGLLSIAYIALTAAAVHFGAGRHATTLEPADRNKSILLINIAFVPGVLCFVIPKFAVVILLSRILNPGRTHRRIMWVVSVIYGALAVGLLVVNFTQCSPPAALWGEAEGKCLDRRVIVNYALAVGISSAVFDFYLASYPTWVLSGLMMYWRRKVALSSSLGFGYCAGAITIYKCTWVPTLKHVDDFTYAADNVVLWTM
ncbi:hypothetical protein jhhlp_006685 [Lomentospora prolificans]|uniref:Rhodopsin domain-containing protein n=1 Tax=Lomentospora prolificans TaxID=41688 RepID=A0A2N3N6J5_9PEZI|nr:hypothetical protein jhhlp_006685 [Lomentospora prolificans]